MAESFGVAGLGRVHDESGAIRDVLRNHLLQVVGFSPWNLPRSCRRELFVTNISRYSVRSHPLQPTMQFGLSSRDTTMKNGVAPDSQVETYAAVRLHLDSWRWTGVF
jgi:glucose-6-phosphate 1-dehydrogenase